jgi:hypothetical protein
MFTLRCAYPFRELFNPWKRRVGNHAHVGRHRGTAVTDDKVQQGPRQLIWPEIDPDERLCGVDANLSLNLGLIFGGPCGPCSSPRATPIEVQRYHCGRRRNSRHNDLCAHAITLSRRTNSHTGGITGFGTSRTETAHCRPDATDRQSSDRQ